MQRISFLLFSVAALSVSALAGCHNDDKDQHHARSADTYYDRSQTAGDRVYGGGTAATPPVDNAADTGTGGANDSSVAPSRPGTSGTAAPAQLSNPDPPVNAPRDTTDAK
jgi:hypothetical protein